MGSDNGLLLTRRQAIIWANDGKFSATRFQWVNSSSANPFTFTGPELCYHDICRYPSIYQCYAISRHTYDYTDMFVLCFNDPQYVSIGLMCLAVPLLNLLLNRTALALFLPSFFQYHFALFAPLFWRRQVASICLWHIATMWTDTDDINGNDIWYVLKTPSILIIMLPPYTVNIYDMYIGFFEDIILLHINTSTDGLFISFPGMRYTQKK